MFFRNLNWDIIGQRNYWFGLSAAVILAGAIALIVHHGLPLGLSFTGGTVIDVKFSSSVTETQVKAALRGVEVVDKPGLTPQQIASNADLRAGLAPLTRGEGNVQLASKPEDKAPNERAIVSLQSSISDASPVFDALDRAGLTVDRGQSQITSVGPSLGREYLSRSFLALVIALLLQLVYIAFRFGNQLRYGVLCDVKLVHDVLVMVGIFAIANRRADDAFLAALLTVIGWSVMDSIVIFDRIRENTHVMPDVPYDRMVNTSLLQTMTRSVNTLATVVIVLVALLLFGGDTLKDFAFALLVGVISGAYSSIFIASPLLVMWKQYDVRKRQADRAAVVASEASLATAGADGQSMRRIAPKQKRSSLPPPRYRKRRPGILGGPDAASDGADGGVLTQADEAGVDDSVEPGGRDIQP